MGYIGAGPTRFNTADELTVTGDAEFNGDLTVKGTHITLDSATVQTVDLGDNDKIRLGDSDDLQIYHDGSNSIINDAGTGSLKFQYGGTDGVVFDSTGNVGIGTISPASALHISSNTYPQLELDDKASRNYAMGVTASTFRIRDVTGAADRLTIDTSGNVGIGTSSPLGILDASYGGYTAAAKKALVVGADINSTSRNLNTRKIGTIAAPHYDNGDEIALMRIDSDSSTTEFIIGGTPELRGATFINFRTASTTTGTPSERMRIDSSGRVGIGTNTPSAVLDVKSSGATSTAFRVLRSDAAANLHALTEISGHGRLSVYDGSENEDIRLDSNGDSYFTGGNLLVADTTNVGTADHKVSIQKGTSGRNLGLGTTLTSATVMMSLVNGNGTVGTIQTNGSGTSYVTSSDYRLKENVVADWDATTRLKQLNPVRFNFIADADTTVDGFLAHEVQTVVPEAITGTHNGMRDEEYEVSAATGDIYTPAIEAVLDEDGNEVTPAVAEVIHSTDAERPEELAEGQQWRETTAAVMGTRSVPDYQGIDQSKLVPLLVKTIQELEARIVALETA